MNAKEYFYKNFDDKYAMHLDSDLISKLRVAYPLQEDNIKYISNAYAKRADLKYGNDLLMNTIVMDFLANNRMLCVDDNIFLGKLANEYAHCYLVKENEELSGALICYTSGLSEISYLAAKLFIANQLLKQTEKDDIKTILLKYKDYLIHDFAYRLLHYDLDIDFASLFDDSDFENLYPDVFMFKSADFASMIDKFFISHELAHYFIEKNDTAFVKKVSSISRLIFDEAFEMFENEVFADIGGVLIFLGYDDICNIELQTSKIVSSFNRKVQIDVIGTFALIYAIFILSLINQKDNWYDYSKRYKTISKTMYLFDGSTMLVNAIEFNTIISEIHNYYQGIKKDNDMKDEN